jgi:hypothetical protein
MLLCFALLCFALLCFALLACYIFFITYFPRFVNLVGFLELVWSFLGVFFLFFFWRVGSRLRGGCEAVGDEGCGKEGCEEVRKRGWGGTGMEKEGERAAE